MYCLIAEGRIASSPSECIVSNAVYCAVDVTYILSDASYLMAAQTRAEGAEVEGTQGHGHVLVTLAAEKADSAVMYCGSESLGGY